MHAPQTSLRVYWYSIPKIEALLKRVTDQPIKQWRCPCADMQCKAIVLYARCSNPTNGQPAFCFVATTTFVPETDGRDILVVENIEDFNLDPHPGSAPQLGFEAPPKSFNESDLAMYKVWFTCGLKEAILNA